MCALTTQKEGGAVSVKRWQQALFDSVVKRDGRAMKSLLVCDDTLDVYQRNAHYALIGVLKLNYEHCCALLGDVCFERLAMQYVARHFPQDNNLDVYGAAFADFVVQTGEHDVGLQTLPYIADVARLDYAITQSYHAPNEDRFDASAFAQLDDVQKERVSFVLADHVHVLQSRWPLHEIVALNKGDQEGVQLSAHSDILYFLVCQAAFDVPIKNINHEQASMLKAVQAGARLHVLVDTFSQQVPFLLACIEQGLIARFVLSESEQNDV